MTKSNKSEDWTNAIFLLRLTIPHSKSLEKYFEIIILMQSSFRLLLAPLALPVSRSLLRQPTTCDDGTRWHFNSIFMFYSHHHRNLLFQATCRRQSLAKPHMYSTSVFTTTQRELENGIRTGDSAMRKKRTYARQCLLWIFQFSSGWWRKNAIYTLSNCPSWSRGIPSTVDFFRTERRMCAGRLKPILVSLYFVLVYFP